MIIVNVANNMLPISIIQLESDYPSSPIQYRLEGLINNKWVPVSSSKDNPLHFKYEPLKFNCSKYRLTIQDQRVNMEWEYFGEVTSTTPP